MFLGPTGLSGRVSGKQTTSPVFSTTGGKNEGLDPSPPIVSQCCIHSTKVANPPPLPSSSIQRPSTHVNVLNGFCSLEFHL